MSYLSDITKPLVATLRHLATLPAHQLAGHAANLDFWKGEVAHRRHLIESYCTRFERLQAAEQAYGKIHGFGRVRIDSFSSSDVEPIKSLPPTRPSSKDSERQGLLRELDSAFNALQARLDAEQLPLNSASKP